MVEETKWGKYSKGMCTNKATDWGGCALAEFHSAPKF